ncbi:MAG: DUF4091 domain-containing protein [Lentisphaerae bacterium]|nr:DUF4091 domain-containing protein [Lentisphaerota bacterium]
MKKLLTVALFVLFSGLFAAPVLTVIGGKGELKLQQYGLIVNYFAPQEKMSRADTLKLCEAIDNSKLVIYYAGVKTAQVVFEDTSVQQALTNLFKRGGGIYIGIPSWTWMKEKPQAMFDFFKSIQAPLPEKYAGFGKGRSSMTGQIAAAFADSWAAKPNRSFPLSSRGHAGKNYDKRWQVLLESSSENFPLALVRNDVLGKGLIVCNYAAMVHYRPVSPFLENLITYLYGDRNVGMGRRGTKKAAAAEPTAAEINYLDITQKNTLKLALSGSGKSPQCPTTVKVTAADGKLIIDYNCRTANPELLRRRIKKADGPVWTDDCVEIFIADGLKESANNFHFALNADNVLFDSRNSSPLWNCPGIKTAAAVTDTGYTAYLEIPFSALNIKPAAGEYFRANFCREARGGVKNATYELQSYSVGSTLRANLAYVGFDGKAPELGKKRSNKASDGVQIYQVLPFTRIYPDFEPAPGTAETEKVSFTLARNDREGIPVVLYNGSDVNLRYRIEPDEYLANTQISYKKIIKVKEMLPYRAVNKQVFYDIISELNQAGVVSVPGLDIGAIYLEAFTQLPPGKYQWGLTLVPVNADVPQKRLNVEFEVVNLTMPEKLPVDFYLFGPYVAEQRYHVGRPDFTRGQFDKYNEFFKSYHVNCIHVWDPLTRAVKIQNGQVTVSDQKSDYLFREKEWQASGMEWSYHYGVWAVLYSRLKAAKLPCTLKDPATRAIFEKAISNWSKFMREENIDFNKCYVPVWDEPRTADLDDVIIAAEIVRKHGFRVNQTMANWSVVEDFRKLKDSVDYWIPIEYLVVTSGSAAEVRNIIKASGKKLAPYMCSIGGVLEHYHEYYRFRGIKEYLIGADGVFLWSANSWRGNDYDSREDKRMRGMHVIHHSDSGPVPTMRFEALREAVEDLYYLKLAAASGKPGVQKWIAPEYLRKLMQNNDPAEIAYWHAQLLKALAD